MKYLLKVASISEIKQAHEDLILLRKILEEGLQDPDSGICFYMGDRKVFKELSKAWPKFSGRQNFPVPDGGYSPSSRFFNVDDLWDQDTQYGRDRRELVELCIS